eukprot:gnl/TRDRNA2_/TRDRNA2_143889_c1_seq1.p1 gnl/TRDRNA2_/TRDRNA2_143889_c1~~gnl/TRDRNA2_/TRDRNA2_143889_c1_seq1.p1  ORF type:complete len:812 (+),score=94.90 gnl/TRDRNA2_/TRDRNA2_143889_c1_seq1:104-2437(+)
MQCNGHFVDDKSDHLESSIANRLDAPHAFLELSDCKLLCELTATCSAVTFLPTDGRCYLFRSCGNTSVWPAVSDAVVYNLIRWSEPVHNMRCAMPETALHWTLLSSTAVGGQDDSNLLNKCKEECAQRRSSECRAITFFPVGSSNRAFAGRCFMLPSCSPESADATEGVTIMYAFRDELDVVPDWSAPRNARAILGRFIDDVSGGDWKDVSARKNNPHAIFTDVSDCKKLCEQTPSCAAVSYFPSSSDEDWRHKCHLFRDFVESTSLFSEAVLAAAPAATGELHVLVRWLPPSRSLKCSMPSGPKQQPNLVDGPQQVSRPDTSGSRDDAILKSCKSACAREKDCTAITYYPATAQAGMANKCFMFSGCTPEYTDAGVSVYYPWRGEPAVEASWSKTEYGRECVGLMVDQEPGDPMEGPVERKFNPHAYFDDVQDCRTLCAENPFCQAISYFPTTVSNPDWRKKCYLFRECGSRTAPVPIPEVQTHVLTRWLPPSHFIQCAERQEIVRIPVAEGSHSGALDNANLEALQQCKDLCSADPQCKAITHFPAHMDAVGAADMHPGRLSLCYKSSRCLPIASPGDGVVHYPWHGVAIMRTAGGAQVALTWSEPVTGRHCIGRFVDGDFDREGPTDRLHNPHAFFTDVTDCKRLCEEASTCTAISYFPSEARMWGSRNFKQHCYMFGSCVAAANPDVPEAVVLQLKRPTAAELVMLTTPQPSAVRPAYYNFYQHDGGLGEQPTVVVANNFDPSCNCPMLSWFGGVGGAMCRGLVCRSSGQAIR